jgi:hypothetical protein
MFVTYKVHIKNIDVLIPQRRWCGFCVEIISSGKN